MIGIGTTLNQRFLLERELGRGGMGAVYSATDQVLQRNVAIKVLKEQSGEEVGKRLRLEAQIAARLLHDNVVRIYDFGQAEGTWYLVMEQVDGTSYVKRWRQLPLAERLRILAQVADALDYAHHQGVIHRDIKPGNVLLTPADVAKLSDFGLSLLAEQADDGDDPGHAALHEPRAGPGQAAGLPDRPLLAGGDGLRVGDRARAVHGHGDVDHGAARRRAARRRRGPRPEISADPEVPCWDSWPSRWIAGRADRVRAPGQEIRADPAGGERGLAGDRRGLTPRAAGRRRPQGPNPCARRGGAGGGPRGGPGAGGTGPAPRPLRRRRRGRQADLAAPPRSQAARPAGGCRGVPPRPPVRRPRSGAPPPAHPAPRRQHRRGTAWPPRPWSGKMLRTVLEEPVMLSAEERYLQGQYLAYLLIGSRRKGSCSAGPSTAATPTVRGTSWASPTPWPAGPPRRRSSRPRSSSSSGSRSAPAQPGGGGEVPELARHARPAAALPPDPQGPPGRQPLRPEAHDRRQGGAQPRHDPPVARRPPQDRPGPRAGGRRAGGAVEPAGRGLARPPRAPRRGAGLCVPRAAPRPGQPGPLARGRLSPDRAGPLAAAVPLAGEALWDAVVGRLFHVGDAGVELDRVRPRRPRPGRGPEIDDSVNLLAGSPRPRTRTGAGGPGRRSRPADRLDPAGSLNLAEIAADRRRRQGEGLVRLAEPDPVRFLQGQLHELWKEAVNALQAQGRGPRRRAGRRRRPAGHRHIPLGPYRLVVVASIRGRAAGQVAIQGMANKQLELTTPSFRTTGLGGQADPGRLDLPRQQPGHRPPRLQGHRDATSSGTPRKVTSLTVALAVPKLKSSDFIQIGPGSPVAGHPIGVIGPGTGLGVSGLIPAGGGWIPLQSEGGHVTLAPANVRESEVLNLIRCRLDHVSTERLVSGPGLVNLYRALCELDGVPAASFSPAEIADPLVGMKDTRALEAVKMFCAMLGTAAGNLALTLGAQGGIYIAGGIVPGLGANFQRSTFRQAFEGKGRFQDYLLKIPTYVITRPLPALLGAAYLLERGDFQKARD